MTEWKKSDNGLFLYDGKTPESSKYKISRAYNGERWICTAWRSGKPIAYVRTAEEAKLICETDLSWSK